MDNRYTLGTGLCAFAFVCLTGCATVKVEAPDKPIEINMNVKIEHHIRVEIERELDALLMENKGLF